LRPLVLSVSLSELTAQPFARLAADELDQEVAGRLFGIVGFCVNVAPVTAHDAPKQHEHLGAPLAALYGQLAQHVPQTGICQPTCARRPMLLETDVMADELKDLRIPVMMAATEVAAIDDWRRRQPDLPSRSEAIRRLVELGLKAKGK
jgi:hypothetical protein